MLLELCDAFDGAYPDGVEPPARSDAISLDIVETKSCFDTVPVPVGSSWAKIAAGHFVQEWGEDALKGALALLS
jgi:hypothetical protein